MAALSALLYTRIVDTTTEDFMADVNRLLNAVLSAVVEGDIRLLNHNKFHIILHILDCMRRLGPPMLYATEKFESFNAIMRNHSVHTNRHAPSKDIAVRFARYQTMRHLVSGGYYWSGASEGDRAEADGAMGQEGAVEQGADQPGADQPGADQRGAERAGAERAAGQWERAGEDLIGLLELPQVRKLYGVLSEDPPLAPKRKINRKPIKFEATVAGGSHNDRHHLNVKLTFSWQALHVDKHRKLVVGEFALLFDKTIARVEEISTFPNDNESILIGVSLFDVLDATWQGCPVIAAPADARRRLVSVSDIEGPVNTQHHCSFLGCEIAKSKEPTRQERVSVVKLKEKIIHIPTELLSTLAYSAPHGFANYSQCRSTMVTTT
ncbi:uncharacterized protein EV422DRAFT_516452 [Fimicolochytrium jonesii]|uniref:uncharacterized protein n=1 Tax=Fimicolochytrium jonesii TaxID=1396493 RepID=UPI0022FE61B7|nr:uncharacterized protein EV422DRAFT_516452 [Fimicolochytrium jonesii]KAI8824864.1 hypothetical protein EV422DRAFT_516452 [Fimicolochytrium jonesii]